MNIQFKNLLFEIENEIIFLKSFGDFVSNNTCNFVDITVSGENKVSHSGVKMNASSEGRRFKYVSHELSDNKFVIVQQSPVVRVETTFEGYADTDTVCVHNVVTNTTEKTITLEEVSSFVLGGILGNASFDNLYLTTFAQSHNTECQPVKLSFKDHGFFVERHGGSSKRIAFANIGGWSTKEKLPQGIIQNAETNSFLMFQIESNNSWYFEISDRENDMYLYTGGANITFGSWYKKLAPGESYETVKTAVSVGKNDEDVIGEMTKYRRHISGLFNIDKHLPSIFNEYMHLSGDNPNEETTKIYAPVVAKTGVEYYVIDCGWHDECPANIVYHHMGAWKESKLRFPSGLKKTMEFIKSLGMKPGLWIEPEIIGCKCDEMLEYYDDDCFWQRNGERLLVFNRYFLDYRNPKVIGYMSETIRRMVEDYGAEYIKFDWNQEPGVGTDLNANSFGEGLELCAKAFFDWIESMKKRFPNVIFEGCSSGGNRLDYKTLRTFSLASTSDQTLYQNYPYIAGNILSAVIPEQAAVWAYPVGHCSAETITDRQIIVNMINSFLGRMHLASHLERMTDSQLALVREGIDVYNMLTPFKKEALPCFPNGFTHFGDTLVCAGFKKDNKVYLAVWNLDTNAAEYTIPFERDIYSAKVVYPAKENCNYSIVDNELSVAFDEGISASFFEINLA